MLLGLTNALGIVAGAVGLNALIKSNQEQTRLRHAAPKGVTVYINVNDAYHTGVVSTTISATIGLVTFIFLSFYVIKPKFTSGRPLRLQGAILAFLALWLFAVETAFTVIFATKEAQVSATIGGMQVPQDAIKKVETSLHSTRVYKDIWYRE